PPAQGCQGGAIEPCPASELRCPQRGVEGALAVDLKVPRLEDPSADGSRWLADCFPTQHVHGDSGHDDLEGDAVEKRSGRWALVGLGGSRRAPALELGMAVPATCAGVGGRRTERPV